MWRMNRKLQSLLNYDNNQITITTEPSQFCSVAGLQFWRECKSMKRVNDVPRLFSFRIQFIAFKFNAKHECHRWNAFDCHASELGIHSTVAMHIFICTQRYKCIDHIYFHAFTIKNRIFVFLYFTKIVNIVIPFVVMQMVRMRSKKDWQHIRIRTYTYIFTFEKRQSRKKNQLTFALHSHVDFYSHYYY